MILYNPFSSYLAPDHFLFISVTHDTVTVVQFIPNGFPDTSMTHSPTAIMFTHITAITHKSFVHLFKM